MFDGQEKATITFDGETKITAFNMEEEMQQGHFDKEGTFIFKKEKEEIKDSWLDNIDWVKVKEREEIEEKEKGLADSSDSESDAPQTVDIKATYAKMLEVMRPGEDVLRCIKRLGGGQHGSRSNRKDKRKLNPEQQAVLDKIVGCAGDILATGDMDIYQRTYEQLRLALAPKKDTSDMDIFADDETTADIKKNNDTPSTSESSSADFMVTGDEKVMWEYKWDEENGSQVYGPYSSEDMLAWSEQGYFRDGVYVRKKDEEKFYSSKRIDFDLYV
ncbi:CD2 antigen cytoplasmic tail-binding protein 2 homolog isoform X2 [Varroa jacobsoni]|nr:CD2 antigen cytoplasmic tail-binding protein 2 homolog isoform X2 [Varroa destructor]XP_022692005.1 CD2 antigen cytoplasmic tail-binding protein 2 homolog isoform X2 [Varroa jacobsoni]